LLKILRQKRRFPAVKAKGGVNPLDAALTELIERE
jgi:hypothetical protein